MSQAIDLTDDQLCSLSQSQYYTARWNIVQAQGTSYPFSLIIFIVKCTYYTENVECGPVQASLMFENPSTFSLAVK